MIKLPINPLTPPVRFDRLNRNKPNRQASTRTGTAGGASHAAAPDIPSFESLFSEMLAHYMPETVEFTPLSEDVLRDTIRNWLRPAYEQAIEARRDQTQRYNAELDADAWSRGMGQSTYLTDVKERQYRGEARDVDALESDYASTLAGHLYDAMQKQQEAQLEVDRFNAEQINHAREQAMSAAQALYNSYLSRASHSGSGRQSVDTTDEETASSVDPLLQNLLASQQDMPKTDYRTVANALARMSPIERGKLYNRSDPTYLSLRSEILMSLGPEAFNTLMQTFPGA